MGVISSNKGTALRPTVEPGSGSFLPFPRPLPSWPTPGGPFQPWLWLLRHYGRAWGVSEERGENLVEESRTGLAAALRTQQSDLVILGKGSIGLAAEFFVFLAVLQARCDGCGGEMDQTNGPNNSNSTPAATLPAHRRPFPGRRRSRCSWPGGQRPAAAHQPVQRFSSWLGFSGWDRCRRSGRPPCCRAAWPRSPWPSALAGGWT